jgi:GNAT superfamily N-acetyltransferase
MTVVKVQRRTTWLTLCSMWEKLLAEDFFVRHIARAEETDEFLVREMYQADTDTSFDSRIILETLKRKHAIKCACVHTTLRGRREIMYLAGPGYGAAMLGGIEKKAKSKGEYGMSLVVHIKNERAIAFYERMGFIEVEGSLREDGHFQMTKTWRSVGIGPSTIHGLGLFAAVAHKADSMIGIYNHGARVLSKKELMRLYPEQDARYVLQVTMDMYLDGAPGVCDDVCFMAYANHARKPNARYCIDQSKKTVSLKAIRNIEKGEEITCSYGPDYIIY